MKIWGASLLAGVLALLLGGALFLLKLHRTIGLGGIGLGAVLVAIGFGLLYQERGERVGASRNSSPSAQKTTLRAPTIRALAAVGIIILVGAGAFYATSYLVSIQGGSQTSTGPGTPPTPSQTSSTSQTSQTSQSSTSTSGPPVTRTTSTCLAAPNGLCSSSTSTISTTATTSTYSQSASSSFSSTTTTSTVTPTSTITTTTSSTTNSVSSSSGPVSIAFINLYSGAPSSPSSQGTAYLYLVLRNTGPATQIDSITLSGGNLTGSPPVYICSSTNSCSQFTSVEVNPDSATTYTGPTTAFYLGAGLTQGTLYDFEISIANGQTIVGSIRAG